MNGTIPQTLLLVASLVAAGLAGVRWLRVAQREHYLAGSVARFAGRWWSLGPNRLLGAAAVVGLAAAALGVTPAGLVAAAAVACGPFGLSLRGRTAKLVWTRRLKSLAAVGGTIIAVVVALAALGGLAVAAAVATLLAIAVPLIVDAALAITAPLERRLANRFVRQASAKLEAVHPKVVAITGSYGKTSTKGYLTHLLTGSLTVVPSPASYNNRAGLARAVNEKLAPGTEVFIAEMGTYGPGEIAEMCAWVRPDVAVITAIGPVHLERMGEEANIAKAKAEILAQAKVAVLNIDSPWLAPIAAQAAAEGKRVYRCSATDREADVCVVDDGDETLRVFVSAASRSGDTAASSMGELAKLDAVDAPATNVACAVAVALELDVRPDLIAKRLVDLPTAAHRRETTTGRTGATIIDDTYNANPAGAAAALRLLSRLASGERRSIVVTPGMVELGERQEEENARFAAAAAQ
ncbi:MAG TPA: Mur ligase family protein, partial [Acidimicrobiales bacterium]|nr:Mur ligase family protein [Acidimicrobiales bacterium]